MSIVQCKTVMQGVVVRIYPDEEQEQKIQQAFGNTRYTWNQYLRMMIERYKNNPDLPFISRYDLVSLLPTMKKYDTFLGDSDSTSLQYVVETLHRAYIDFFKKTRGFPNFKAKHTAKKSYTSKNNNNSVDLFDDKIKLPKLGEMPASWSNNLSYERIIKATITQHPSGKYTASVLVEREIQTFEETGQSIGLDMGQTDLMIGSDGIRVSTRQYLVYQAKLRSWQHKMARRGRLAKERGVLLAEAKNYQVAKRMVAKWHEKIRNCRTDYLHKQTTAIVKNYDFIAIEDLGIQRMMTSRPVSGRQAKRANNHKVANQSWHTIRTMLEYKAAWYGKEVVAVDPRYTSQDCSSCLVRTGPKNDLSVRNWTCSSCQVTHDRDINAAKNILQRGLDKYTVA